MRQRKGLLKKTVVLFDAMRDVVGEEAVPLLTYLRDKQDISEFQIAKNIKAEVGWVRQILYKLQTNNLVTYFRKKDQIKGWYISYWTLNPLGAQHFVHKNARNQLSELKERLAKEERHKNQFYICPDFCTRLIFEEATETHFSCPECGKLLQVQDNAKTISQLKERIALIEQ